MEKDDKKAAMPEPTNEIKVPENCVLLKKREYQDLKHTLKRLQEKQNIIKIEISRYWGGDFKSELNVKGAIDLSDSLVSQIKNIANLIMEKSYGDYAQISDAMKTLKTSEDKLSMEQRDIKRAIRTLFNTFDDNLDKINWFQRVFAWRMVKKYLKLAKINKNKNLFNINQD